jgi:hypothetical protein
MPQIKKNTLLLQFIGSFFITLIFLLSCDDSPNGPEEPPPGRRDYTWKVDTLDILFNNLFELWGSSPEAVWAIGAGGEAKNYVWYYNGTTWESYNRFVGAVPIGIDGFAQDDVWIGGDQSTVLQYDGQNWEKKEILNGLGISDFRGIVDFAGSSSSDMYAVGYEDSSGTKLSLAYHYNGGEWSLLNTKNMNAYFYRIKKETFSDRYYFLGVMSNNIDPDRRVVWLYENSEFQLIEKDTYSNETAITTQKIGDHVYMNYGYRIYKLDGLKRELIYVVDDEQYGLQVYGRNEKDLILRMFDGVAHYNGIDHEYLINFEEGVSINDIIVFDTHVFVLAYDSYNSINLVYKGTLN